MRRVSIVTTAAPPWKTGTAVNPTLRAAYLERLGFSVCIAYPWIEQREEQRKLFGEYTFANMAEQETFIRQWIRDNALLEFKGMIVFYNASYEESIGCILQKQNVNIIDSIPSHYKDIAILEEPEHLNWVNTDSMWKEKFNYVIGIIHTNYVMYSGNRDGWFRGQLTKLWGKFVCESHTDHILHLSKATLTSELTGRICPVHGARPAFFNRVTGMKLTGIYFLAKALWDKGYRNLVTMYERDNTLPEIDSFGSGVDFEDIVSHIEGKALRIKHSAGCDHLTDFQSYKTFFNPSTSDALCTTTSEALAMEKFVILPVHPSNEYFYTFRNCLLYSSDEELRECFRRAQKENPRKLTRWEREHLSWERATRKLVLHAIARRQHSIKELLLEKTCYVTQCILDPRPIHNIMRHTIGVRCEELTFEDRRSMLLIILIVCAVCSGIRKQCR